MSRKKANFFQKYILKGSSGNCVPVLPLKSSQKDTERYRKTQKDTERKHEKLEKCEIHQKAIKNILNLSCHFGFFVKFVQDTFSAFFPLSFQCESESFCVLSGEIGTWISTPFPEVPDFHGNE